MFRKTPLTFSFSQVVLGPAVSIKANDILGAGREYSFWYRCVWRGKRFCPYQLLSWCKPLQTPRLRKESATSPLTSESAPVIHIYTSSCKHTKMCVSKWVLCKKHQPNAFIYTLAQLQTNTYLQHCLPPPALLLATGWLAQWVSVKMVYTGYVSG